jgi:uncharacterized protein (TIGR02001 family)
MKNMLKQSLRALCLCTLAASAQGQSADPAASGAPPAATAPFAANVTLISQYVSRGFRQSWGKPALQGGFDYAHPSGFSAGTWLSSISNRYVENGSIEWDLYAGYTGALDALGYSATLVYYKYPGAEYTATKVRYDYGELALGLTYKFLYAKYNSTYTADFFGITQARGTGYLDLGANYELVAGTTLNLHVGDLRVAGTGNKIWNARDYKIGLSQTLDGGWTVAAAYTKAKGATNVYDNYTIGVPNSAGVIETSNPAAGTVLLSLTKLF